MLIRIDVEQVPYRKLVVGFHPFAVIIGARELKSSFTNEVWRFLLSFSVSLFPGETQLLIAKDRMNLF